ncbi:lysophospholipid acyltransferase family protein [Demequina lignilytica]|uniref:Lysophospholipid acyltransferase family protein n=1 Tax=Demequina lignilytica TaxID=3051663 RepID=A0AB35MKY3_9MICO|nr:MULTISPECIES: lysophospholipid acyltransferase family protein [unclassified Demequina]MDN4484481.1 lysophospholipid acyltransferase family protein [Demequina sp. SYSU T0a273]MDN4489222.1 lysophospholipid acyltransferase family protein [Demequina sp. SYSU T00068]
MSPAVPSRWGPRWSRWVGRFLARVLWRTEVRGRDNVPRTGAAIVVCNHLGLIDGPVVHGVIPRGSHFLIRIEMMTGPLGGILRAAQQITVEGAGREALAQGLAVLRRGDVIGVFPEGTRGAGTATAVHGGAAWLAIQSGAPVVPTTIVGSRRTGESVNIWPRPGRRLLVAFGEPVVLTPPPEVRGGRAKQEWAAERLAEALRQQVARTLETTDLELPLDDPRRENRGGEDQA